jgi:glycosyltransferase involved in cell wall biosynthesis
MVSEPLVSVIISTYNRPEFLRQSVASVLAQTLADFELIVCDDASELPDRVWAAIPTDSRIQYIRSSCNLGTAANNAQGYQLARGRYVAHLDDDDLWHPEYLQHLVEALEARPDCSLAFCNHIVIDGNGHPDLHATRRAEAKWGRADLLEGVYRPFWDLAVVRRAIPTSHASVIRREALTDIAGLPDTGYAWDLFLSYQAARGGHGAYFIPERLSLYRVHGRQQSSPVTHRGIYQSLTHCDRLFLADPKLEVDRSVLSARLARVTAFGAVALLRLRRVDEARSALGDAGLGFWVVAAKILAHLPAGFVFARLAFRTAVIFRRIRSKRLRRSHRDVFGDRRLRLRGIRVGPPFAGSGARGSGGG